MMETNDDNDIYFAGVITWKDDNSLVVTAPLVIATSGTIAESQRMLLFVVNISYHLLCR